ncbi:MAG TPA: glycosyltransferase family 2 protein, partial [Steroidobacteraceae bacterium]|nr:glycosyltransferase family 2 protein [Steroidobacteraceae bacterium]
RPASQSPMPPPGAELTVIVPTFNERQNVLALIERLRTALGERGWEVIFVDDASPDGTAALVRELARADRRIRCIERFGRRGLSSACVEGMLASAAPYLAVIDADLQHDESLLPAMLEELRRGRAEIVVGSRYAPGGGIGDWDAGRARLSRIGVRLSRILVPEGLTDPMSGFFMMRRAVFERSRERLSGIGFKLLADLFASHPEPLRFKELPYRFRPRHAGASKLDSVTAWDYAMLLLDKMVGHVIPVRFVAFSIVGALGIIVHFAVLTPLLQIAHTRFAVGQAIAALCAMTFNFALNNILTYRDARLRGWRWLRGWLLFVLACSIGGVMNVTVASFIFKAYGTWVIGALGGILVGSMWNYAVTKFFTWERSGT